MKITTEYKGELRFSSGEDDGKVTMDAKPEAGGLGKAPNPKSLVLYGLAGCTGLDVVAILKKKRVEYDGFKIEVEAEQTTTHPKVFKSITIHYQFIGDPEDRKHMERAIELSKGQFCGVSFMLAKTATIETELTITPR